MESLYNIQQEYLELCRDLEENDGELTEEQIEILERNDEDYTQKIKNYRGMIFKWKGEIAAAALESDRIAAYVKKRRALIDRLTINVDETMNSRGLDKLDLGLDGAISYRKSTSVEADVEMLEDKWVREVTTRNADKNAIKKALKDGVLIEGAWTVDRRNIQIK